MTRVYSRLPLQLTTGRAVFRFRRRPAACGLWAQTARCKPVVRFKSKRSWRFDLLKGQGRGQGRKFGAVFLRLFGGAVFERHFFCILIIL